jgi:SAM-dependent methyltransferase
MASSITAVSDKVELHSCPSCGCSRRKRLPTPGRWIGKEFFLGGEWCLERCEGCRLVFTNPRRTEDLLVRFYASKYTPHESDGQNTLVVRRLLLRIEHHFPNLHHSGLFLDFGCGGGSLLRDAAKRGWKVCGYDVATPALGSCRAQGLQVTNDVAALPQRVDAVLMSQALGQVSHFEELFSVLRNRLAPVTGRFIAVPNARSLRALLSPPLLSRFAGVEDRYHAFPIHLSHFSRKSLERLLTGYGFECLAMQTYAFGIDSYLRSDFSPTVTREHSNESEGTTPQAALEKRAKQLIKSVFMGAGLARTYSACSDWRTEDEDSTCATTS